MNELIHILTLQNATFNGWAWAIGTVILLIRIGMRWNDGDEKTIRYFYTNLIYMIFVALIWPISFAITLIMGIIYTPIWIGRKIKKM